MLMNLVAHEEFTGLNKVDVIDSDTLARTIEDCLLRMNLSLNNASKSHIEETRKQKFSRGRPPEPPVREREMLPFVLSPTLVPSALVPIFRRTTFYNVATGLLCGNGLTLYQMTKFWT